MELENGLGHGRGLMLIYLGKLRQGLNDHSIFCTVARSFVSHDVASTRGAGSAAAGAAFLHAESCHMRAPPIGGVDADAILPKVGRDHRALRDQHHLRASRAEPFGDDSLNRPQPTVPIHRRLCLGEGSPGRTPHLRGTNSKPQVLAIPDSDPT